MKVDYLIIVPSRSEVPPFFLLSPFSLFSIRETKKGSVLLFVSGVGKREVKNRIGSVISKFLPERVLITGFCGSRAKEISPGKVVIGENIICGNEILNLDKDYTEEIENALRNSNFSWVKEDIECTGKLELLRGREKPRIVDMESFWIAKEYVKREIPVAFLKVVSDEIVNGNKFLLPFIFLKFIINFLRNRKKGLTLISNLLENYFYNAI